MSRRLPSRVNHVKIIKELLIFTEKHVITKNICKYAKLFKYGRSNMEDGLSIALYTYYELKFGSVSSHLLISRQFVLPLLHLFSDRLGLMPRSFVLMFPSLILFINDNVSTISWAYFTFYFEITFLFILSLAKTSDQWE